MTKIGQSSTARRGGIHCPAIGMTPGSQHLGLRTEETQTKPELLCAGLATPGETITMSNHPLLILAESFMHRCRESLATLKGEVAVEQQERLRGRGCRQTPCAAVVHVR